MNRLSPLIVRSFVPVTASAAPSAAAIAAPEVPAPWDGVERRRPDPYEAAKDFLFAWAGGLVFFGTFLA